MISERGYHETSPSSPFHPQATLLSSHRDEQMTRLAHCIHEAVCLKKRELNIFSSIDLDQKLPDTPRIQLDSRSYASARNTQLTLYDKKQLCQPQ